MPKAMVTALNVSLKKGRANAFPQIRCIFEPWGKAFIFFLAISSIFAEKSMPKTKTSSLVLLMISMGTSPVPHATSSTLPC